MTGSGTTGDKHDQPEAAPRIADRAAFDAALAEQVEREKEVTRHNDRVSAARRRPWSDGGCWNSDDSPIW